MANADNFDFSNEIGKMFPNDAEQYCLIEEIGMGASSVVYRALCKPLNEEVAIKIIDLEKYDDVALILEELYVRFFFLKT